MKVYLLGLGTVGSCFLDLLIDSKIVERKNIFCIEPDINKLDIFLRKKCKRENFICKKITIFNYKNILHEIKENDIIVDLTTQVRNLSILKYCIKFNIHYLSTADSSWPNDIFWKNNYTNFKKYEELKIEGKCKNTSIVQFGMNPGLVSSFVKKCIKDIVRYDKGAYVKNNQRELLHLLSEEKYNEVCKKLGVKYIKEIDYDNQEMINNNIEDNTIYSTWCPIGFFNEALGLPEIAFGDENLFFSYNNFIDFNVEDLFMQISHHSIEHKEKMVTPQGVVEGYICPHEEIFTIRRYLSCEDYRPTCYFVYRPCELALKSISSNVRNKKRHAYKIISVDNIKNGGESVGVILKGDNFRTRYFGNYLSTGDYVVSATIMQVVASTMAAFKYILEFPKGGLLFPEELDEEKVLNYAKKYLIDYISIECDDDYLMLCKKEDIHGHSPTQRRIRIERLRVEEFEREKKEKSMILN